MAQFAARKEGVNVPTVDGVYQIVRKKPIKNKVYLARGKNILPLVPTLANINFTNSNEEGSIF